MNRRTASDWLVVVLVFGLGIYFLPRLGAAWDAAPLWVHVVVAAGVLLLAAVGVADDARRARRAERKALGQCAACGYPLTGNASGVCPECGTPAGPDDAD